MAYITQEQKKEIAANLKEALKGFKGKIKYSLSIRDSRQIIFTLQESPFFCSANGEQDVTIEEGWFKRNRSHSATEIEFLTAVFNCLNEGNFDNSVSQRDYFSVGWYTDLNLGKVGKPYICNAA